MHDLLQSSFKLAPDANCMYTHLTLHFEGNYSKVYLEFPATGKFMLKLYNLQLVLGFGKLLITEYVEVNQYTKLIIVRCH